MSAPYSSLLTKTETAFKTVIAAGTTLLPELGHYEALRSENKVTPHTKVRVVNGPEYPRDTGNRKLRVELTICSTADASEEIPYPETVHSEYVAKVVDLLKADDLAGQLSAAVADFHCYDVKEEDFSHGPVGREFHTQMILEVYCCPADVT